MAARTNYKEEQMLSLEAWLESGCLTDTAGLAKMLGCSASYLNQGRVKGEGPKCIYIANQVRYLPKHIREWLETRTAASSAEAISRGLAQPCKRTRCDARNTNGREPVKMYGRGFQR